MPKPRSRNRHPVQVVSSGPTKYAVQGRAPKYAPIELGVMFCPGCSHSLMVEVKTERLACPNCTGRFTAEQVRASMEGRATMDKARLTKANEQRRAERIEELRRLAEEARNDETCTGIVYYIRFRDVVKIGTSISPANRLGSLPWDELLAVEPGGRAVEQLRHAEWEAHRVNGEWFEMNDAIAEFIESVVVDNVRWIRRTYPKIEILPCPRRQVDFSPGGESISMLDFV